jgi:hypothetical protein
MSAGQFIATLYRESCLPWFAQISNFAKALRYVLDFFGAAALLTAIGVIVMTAKGKPPNAHDFQWFMTKVCPESYVHFRTVTTMHPLPESSLYEACLGEINPTASLP